MGRDGRLGLTLRAGAASLALAGVVMMPSAAHGATVNPIPRLLGPLCNLLSQSFPAVTVFDPDGSGPLPPRPARVTQIRATITGLLGGLCETPVDVNGDGSPDLMVGAWIPLTDNPFNPQHPVIQVRKVTGATLPVKFELVTGNASDPAATKTSFGYDTLASSAPDIFIARADLSDRDHNPATSQTQANLQIGGAGHSITLLNEVFQGDPAGQRTNDTVRRLTYSGDPADGTAVPSNPIIDVTQGPGSAVDLKLHRDTATTLGFELSSPGSSPVSGSLDREPTDVELTSRSNIDGDGDGSPDDQVVDYHAGTSGSPGERVPNATVKIGSADAGTTATIHNLPTTAHFAYNALAAGARFHLYGADARADSATVKVTGNGGSTTGQLVNVPTDLAVTYGSDQSAIDGHYAANARADSAGVTVTNGTATTAGTITNVPTDIGIHYAPTTSGATIHYAADGRADAATVTSDDGAGTTSSAAIAGVPAALDIAYEANDAGGTVHLTSGNGQPGAGPDRAHLEVHSPGDQTATLDLPRAASPAPTGGLPSDVHVDYAKSDGHLHFDYGANATISDGEIRLHNFSGLPSGATDLNLALTGIPTVLAFDATTSNPDPVVTTVPAEPPSNPECADANFRLPGCKCPRNPDGSLKIPGCVDGPPAIDGRKITSTTSDSEISFSAPNEPLGGGELQLTSGPDLRLPDTASFTGNPLDGVLLHDTPGQYVLFARVSQFHSFDLKQHDDSTVGEQFDFTQPDVDQHHSTTHLAFDSSPDNHSLVFNREQAPGGDETVDTVAQLDKLPPKMVLDAAASSTPTEHGFSDLNFSSGQVDNPGNFSYTETTTIAGHQPVVTRQANLTPMPTSLHVCQAGETAVCAGGTFDANLARMANADFDSSGGICANGCQPLTFDPQVANQGSILLSAEPQTHLTYDAVSQTGATTSLDFPQLGRFVLQGQETPISCSFAACHKGYLAIDTGGNVLPGTIHQTSPGSADTTFSFTPGFHADNWVFGFNRDTALTFIVAGDGKVTCEEGHDVIKPSGNDITAPFCHPLLAKAI
jgi:hypothetical protein